MSDREPLQAYADRLLSIGNDGSHPAGAVLGLRTPHRSEVAPAGWADLPSGEHPGVPMRPDHMLDLASVTKVVATTAITMRLVASGEVHLDDPVHRHLPGFDQHGKDRITLEMLLTHTAGLRPWWPVYTAGVGRRDEAIRVVADLPLAYPPGTDRIYSDLGLILAGAVLEQVTTLRLDEAYDQLVAAPLGLSARFGPLAADRVATSADSDGYERAMLATDQPRPVGIDPDRFTGWRDRRLRGEVNDGNAAHALDGVAGHAGLFATVDDLLTYGAALCEGSFVPREVLDRFAAPHPDHPDQAVGAFLGRAGEVTYLQHPGFTGTYLAIAPATGVVVAGGATRLHGPLGPLGPLDRVPTRLPEVATGLEVIEVLLDAAGLKVAR
ncbi:CubicO group peptidase (beta-lactamase class C family) [Nocardioides albertanoniae]|uniref:CubicO group peptidase (Beta-lactamase class C family) n=1 Tax=Nocardioides albertanoniae TaxID=1175486 RepID=A0A543A5W1_9ACTN|nr:serine hydrolase domain-containing protein [Nocardioides albertanoniae]TQL67993.1 CubicO group peptidase (beta-lactamase class C family) [Nocardioides albertanoniae]